MTLDNAANLYPDIDTLDTEYPRKQIPATPKELHGRLIVEIYAVIEDPEMQTNYIEIVKTFTKAELTSIIYEWRGIDRTASNQTLLMLLIDRQLEAKKMISTEPELQQTSNLEA